MLRLDEGVVEAAYIVSALCYAFIVGVLVEQWRAKRAAKPPTGEQVLGATVLERANMVSVIEKCGGDGLAYRAGFGFRLDGKRYKVSVTKEDGQSGNERT
jgi:hypothetical protein